MFNFLKMLKCEILFISILPELFIRIMFDKNFNENSKGSKYAQFVMKQLEKECKNA